MDKIGPILPLVGIALVFWLLVLRPAQRRQRAVGSMQRALSVGDRVMLTSGIYGTVIAEDEKSVSLEVAQGVVLEVARAAVGSRVDADGDPIDPRRTTPTRADDEDDTDEHQHDDVHHDEPGRADDEQSADPEPAEHHRSGEPEEK